MLGGSSIQDAFPQSDTTPVVPHIIEKDTGWPLNLSEFTEPLLKIAQSSETDILAFVSHCHPSTTKTVHDVFERIQNSLAGDVVCGIPEPKTSIVGPFIGKVLREAILDADFHYDVEYAKGMYPCNFRQPGKQLIRNTGTANAIVTKPLPLPLDIDSDSNFTASSSVMEWSWSPAASGDQSHVSSHLTSPPVSSEHKMDSAPISPAVAEPDTRHTETAKLSPTSSRVGSEVSSRMTPAGARLRSSYTRSHDPSEFMGTLQDISRHDELMDVDSISTLSSEPSEGEGSESIELDEPPITHRHLHLIAHHPPSLNLVSFPLICVASHAEIYSLLASALMHRRVYGVLSPLLGLALDPVKCRLQLVYAWLETPGTHICIEAHAVHASSSLGVDHASGVFDLRVHSSVVSLTAYLLEIASTLLASIDDAKTASLPGVLSSRAWRLNALPLDIETHEENLLEQWLSEIISTFHQSPAPTSSKSSKDSTESQRRSDKLIHQKDEILVDHGTAPARSTSVTRKTSSINSRVSTGSGLRSVPQKVKPDKFDENSMDEDVLILGQAKKKKTRSASSVAAAMSDQPETAATIILDRNGFFARYSMEPLTGASQYPHNVTHDIVQGLIHLGVDEADFEKACIEMRDGKRKFVTPSGAVLAPNAQDLLERIFRTMTVERSFRDYASMPPMGKRLDDVERGILLDVISDVLNASQNAAKTRQTKHNEAEARFAWDSILSTVFSAASQTLLRLEMRVPLPRNNLYDAIKESHYHPDVTIGSIETALAEGTLRDPAFKEERNVEDAREKDIHDQARETIGLLTEQLHFHSKNRLYSIQKDIEGWLKVRKARDVLKRAVSEPSLRPEEIERLGFFATEEAVTGSSPTAQDEESLMFNVTSAIFRGIDKLVDELPSYNGKELSRTQADVVDSPISSLTKAMGHLADELKQEAAPQPPPQPDKKPLDKDSRETLLLLPSIFMEYKRGLIDPIAGINQAKFYLLSATHCLARLGIFDFPVFAVATVGSKGRLLCAWARPMEKLRMEISGLSSKLRKLRYPNPFAKHPTKKDYEGLKTYEPAVVIVDSNCPEWDISVPIEAVRFTLFLIALRTRHHKALLAKFEEVRKDVVEALHTARGDNPKADVEDVKQAKKRFAWKLSHQREEPLKKLLKLAAEEENTSGNANTSNV